MDKGNQGHTSALYVWNGISMFWGTSFHTDPHLHNTLQLVFDIDKSFKLKDAKSDWTTYTSAIINDSHLHQLDSRGSIQLFIYIDKDSRLAKALVAKYLSDCHMADLLGTGIKKLGRDFFKKLLVKNGCRELFKGCQIILNHLIGIEPQPPIDNRVQMAIDFIVEKPVRQFKVGAIADHVCLSESRLRHLFKKQVGQPIQNFILWMKVVDSLNLVLKGKELADVVIETGFWDGSHMNKSYKGLLGITPGSIKEYEKEFKIIACAGMNLQALSTKIWDKWEDNEPKEIIEI
tara:strand:+ start:700 stop:1569 length:870 start_codon:yes stop_codon:yes gene_type:complete